MDHVQADLKRRQSERGYVRLRLCSCRREISERRQHNLFQGPDIGSPRQPPKQTGA